MARKLIIGIYEILNSLNGKRYIGSSSNVRKRITGHKRKLKNGIHSNPHLQSSWNKYGEKPFTFKIIEHCKKEDLLLREQIYLLTYQRSDKWESLYNIAKETAAPMSGKKHTKKAKNKISKANKGKSLTLEHKMKIGDAHRGKKVSKKTRRLLSEAAKGRRMSKSSKLKMSQARMGENNHMYGKKRSQETRRKISESKLGHKLPKSAKRKMAKSSGKLNDTQVLEIRHKYENEGMSQPELALEYGVTSGSISQIVTYRTYKYL